ncbi:MAG: VCBS repeat-containing protein [Acidimicrobiales bacterium]
MRRGRAIAAGLAMLLAAAPIVVPAAAPAAAAPAATSSPAAATQSAPSCQSAPTSSEPLLLPPWADSAGWANADQYATVMAGDIDGDGADELLGRNASNLEVQRWATPFQASAIGAGNTDHVALLPLPGQWIPDRAPGPATPELTTWPGYPGQYQNGYYDVSTYSTMQMADLDGRPGQEVLARLQTGLQLYLYTPAAPGGTSSWQTISTSVFADSWGAQWWQPPYYETITTGDVDGDGVDEIVGRGPGGIQTYKLVNGQLQQIDAGTTILSDAGNVWNQPQHYQTIRLAHLESGKQADLVARGPQGLVVYRFSGGTWTALSTSGPWSDSQGQWKTNPSWYSTIGIADLNGDGVDDVYGRTQYGIDAWTFAGGSWSELVTPPSSSAPTIFTDAQGFDGEAYYATIRAATLGVPTGTTTPVAAHLMGRFPAGQLPAPNQQGGVAFTALASGAFTAPSLVAGQFSDANGWNQPVRYETLRTAHLADGTDLLMGKDATGMRVLRLQGGTTSGGWVSPSASFPAWSTYATTSIPDNPTVLPADPNPTRPPDYPQALWDQQLAAYKAVSQDIGSKAYTDLTPRQALVQANTSDSQVSLTTLAGYAGEAYETTPTGSNVSRDVWDDTVAQTQGWLLNGSHLQSFYFSPNGLQTLIQNTQIVADSGNNSPNAVANHFDKNMAITALVADLIWGLMGALPTGEGVTSLVLTAVFSMTGAGVAGGMGFLNPNGRIDTTANDLNNTLVNSFCAAIDFLSDSYQQTVMDAGLLDAMGRMTTQGPMIITDFPATQTQMTNQRGLWVWQQFANQDKYGWRVGYCPGLQVCDSKGFIDRVNDGYGEFYGLATLGGGEPSQPGCVNVGEQCYGYFYRVLSTDKYGTANCEGTSHGGDGGWYDLTQAGLGFQTQTLFSPRVQPTRMPPDPNMSSNSYQAPLQIGGQGQPSGSSQSMGVLGWRVGSANCVF